MQFIFNSIATCRAVIINKSIILANHLSEDKHSCNAQQRPGITELKLVVRIGRPSVLSMVEKNGL